MTQDLDISQKKKKGKRNWKIVKIKATITFLLPYNQNWVLMNFFFSESATHFIPNSTTNMIIYNISPYFHKLLAALAFTFQTAEFHTSSDTKFLPLLHPSFSPSPKIASFPSICSFSAHILYFHWEV